MSFAIPRSELNPGNAIVSFRCHGIDLGRKLDQPTQSYNNTNILVDMSLLAATLSQTVQMLIGE